MDYVRILQFERWRKASNKIDTTGIDAKIVAEITPMLNADGFIKQRIIGGVQSNTARQAKQVLIYC